MLQLVNLTNQSSNDSLIYSICKTLPKELQQITSSENHVMTTKYYLLSIKSFKIFIIFFQILINFSYYMLKENNQ